MRKIDRDGLLLCDIQAELFEQSVSVLDMSSEIFVRRFMHSRVACELDSKAFLDDTKTNQYIFDSLDEQYGKTSYGSVKYHRDVMYWAGYLYRYFAYTYEISSKQAYKYLPLKDVAGSYLAYHTLDVSLAIERLLEAKGITFDMDELNRRAVAMLREIRAKGGK